MGISLKTHKMLWGRSGNICAIESCRRTLVEDETETDDPYLVGDESHIVARKADGPRGNSTLDSEDRDKYGNLILLCKVCHKLIDDRPEIYTVDVLNQIKYNHIEWISKNLKTDIHKQKDEEYYASYIDEWQKLIVEDWSSWTSYIFGDGQPRISITNFNKLNELNKYLFGRVWPKRYESLEFAFQNFRIVLNDFIKVFDKYKIQIGLKDDSWYFTEKIYNRLKEWDEEQEAILFKKFDFHVALVQDLALELVRAANYLCDQIRKNISSSFRIKEGILLVTLGPTMENFKYKELRCEFNSTEMELVEYPGLLKFMKHRQERGYCFGTGFSADYK